MREKFRSTLAASSQIVCYPTFWFLAYVLCRAKVKSNLVLSKNTQARFVIAANHQSRLDAFIITGILRPRLWSKLLPYRYITANQYLYSWGTGWILWPLGGFPAFPTKYEGWGLEQAQKILKSGQTVCIFPEGRRTRPHEEKPKRGISVLANWPNTYVIPIKLQWHHKPRRVFVSIGKAYKAVGDTPDSILNTIYKLPDIQ